MRTNPASSDQGHLHLPSISAHSAALRAALLLGLAAVGFLACTTDDAGSDDLSSGTNNELNAGELSLWADTAKPGTLADGDTAALEVGVRIKLDVAGTINGFRFYKSSSNKGTHVAHLWSSTGTLLASQTFTSETASGWQTVRLANPFTVNAGTYVVSYHMDGGHYSVNESYFAGRAIDNGQLHALADTSSGHNGVYRYGASAFPTESYRASNYWVDVIFKPKSAVVDAGAPLDSGKPDTSVADTGSGTPDAGTTDAGTSVLSLPRVPWEGGPAYYKKFAKADAAGWSNPGFFPISVFLGKPSHAPQLKAVGVNTYMGAEHDGSSIASMTNLGMYVMAQDEWKPAEVGTDTRVVSWLISDECDMGLGCSGANENENLVAQKAMVATARARNDGRLAFANYGNGLLHTYWAINTMDDLIQVVDVASADKYFYTSPHIWGITPDSPYWPKGAKVASSGSYGWYVDQMKRYQDPNNLHPNWMFVEVARPYLTEAGSLVIKPEQLEGAVWNSIVHEAHGIAYFQHSNDPTCGGYALVDCDQARKDKVKTVNAQIQALAPVINTQSYAYDFANGTETMLKASSGSAYIFVSIGLNQTTGSKTFKLPAGIKGTTVTVVDENRTIPVTNGSFTDTFPNEYTHHNYKIAL